MGCRQLDAPLFELARSAPADAFSCQIDERKKASNTVECRKISQINAASEECRPGTPAENARCNIPAMPPVHLTKRKLRRAELFFGRVHQWSSGMV